MPHGEPSRLSSKDNHQRYEEQMKMREIPIQQLIAPPPLDETYSTPINRLPKPTGRIIAQRPKPLPTPIQAVNTDDIADDSMGELAQPEPNNIRIFEQLPAIYQVLHKYNLLISHTEIEQLINQYGLSIDSSVSRQMFNSILVEIVNIHKRKGSLQTSIPPEPTMPSTAYNPIPVPSYIPDQPKPTHDMTFDIKRPKVPNQLPITPKAPHQQITKFCITSSERNMETWPTPSEFQVPLKSEPNMVVREVRLLSCIFPKTLQGDNIEDYPFIILDIKEVGTVISKQDGQKYGFCHMIFEKDIGKFKVYNNDDPDNKKILFPPVYIETLTISIRKPDGSLFQFAPIRSIEPKAEKRVTFNLAYDPDPLKPIEVPIQPEDPPASSTKDDPYAPITFVFGITFQRRS